MGLYRLPCLFIAHSERSEAAPEDHVLRRSGKGRLIEKVLQLGWQVREHFNLVGFFCFVSDLRSIVLFSIQIHLLLFRSASLDCSVGWGVRCASGERESMVIRRCPSGDTQQMPISQRLAMVRTQKERLFLCFSDSTVQKLFELFFLMLTYNIFQRSVNIRKMMQLMYGIEACPGIDYWLEQSKELCQSLKI